MTGIYLGLGSNLGDREGNLVQALNLLGQQATIEQVSSIYETEPLGFAEQPWFLNAACCVSTALNPLALLSFVKEIEGKLGRSPSFPNAPRTIDIDILLYGDQVIQSGALTIPHPQLGERAFVLIPLAEIASEVVHRTMGKTIKELLAQTKDLHQVRRWKGCLPYQRNSTLTQPTI